jgi:hypothetical protein
MSLISSPSTYCSGLVSSPHSIIGMEVEQYLVSNINVLHTTPRTYA